MLELGLGTQLPNHCLGIWRKRHLLRLRRHSDPEEGALAQPAHRVTFLKAEKQGSGLVLFAVVVLFVCFVSFLYVCRRA